MKFWPEFLRRFRRLLAAYDCGFVLKWYRNHRETDRKPLWLRRWERKNGVGPLVAARKGLELAEDALAGEKADQWRRPW